MEVTPVSGCCVRFTAHAVILSQEFNGILAPFFFIIVKLNTAALIILYMFCFSTEATF